MEVLLVLVLILCAAFWYLYKGEISEQREARRKDLIQAMLMEASGTVMDFLDCGKDVSQATRGRYRGTISVRIHQIYKSGEMGFCITMYDSGDLAALDGALQAYYHLEGFVKKYGYYYDLERESIVFLSSRGVKLLPGEKRELEKQLINRIRNHPLAVVKSENLLGTRGI